MRNRGYTEGTLVGTLRLHGPDAAKLQNVIAKLELTPTTGAPEPGATGRVSDAVLGEITASGRGVLRDVKFAVPLERLPAGPYVARAIVRVDGEVVADVRRPVDVIVGAPPAPLLGTCSAPRPRDALDGEPGRRLIRQASSSPSERIRRAAASAELRQWAVVLTELESAPADDPIANRLRGLARLGREEYALAAAALGLAFGASPDEDAALAFLLGWARIGADDRTGAVTAFRNAMRIEPTMTAAYLALAETYVELGHPALARQALEAGLGALPESSELRRLLAALKK